MNGSSTSDSAPSEARNRGSGGGSPRKYRDLLTGPSDLDVRALSLVKHPSLPCKSHQLDALRLLEDRRGKDDSQTYVIQLVELHEWELHP
jgi:hypothetical protein